MACTRLLAVPRRSSASPSVTGRTRFQSPTLSHCWFLALLCLQCLEVLTVLLGSSLVRSLLLFHVDRVALRRFLYLLLLHLSSKNSTNDLSFVVDALLVLTLLSPDCRVWRWAM